MKAIQIQAKSQATSSIVFVTPFIAYLKKYVTVKRPDRIVVISDDNVGKRIEPYIQKCGYPRFILKHGEKEKSLRNFERLLSFFFINNLSKRSLVVAVGGGMVTDIAGFAASVYYRGIPLITVPTTLLSQIDAAIGGKNTINLLEKKNIVGTVYLPDTIIIDHSFLDTLPDREFSSGMAEIIKYAVGFDKTLIPFLIHKDICRRNLLSLIRRCVVIKSRLVERDIKETKTKRKLLNLGHTLGQALESEEGYAMNHGEAVSIGLLFSLYISYRKHHITKQEFEEIRRILREYHLPPPIRFSVDRMVEKMRYDKKFSGGSMDFILIRSLGTSYICKMSLAEIRLYLVSFMTFISRYEI